MQIIVTNDDGFMAPGIIALAESLRQIGDVVLAAPMEEKSAIGHGITLRDPIRIKKLTLPGIREAWAVGGTPADCVKLAMKELVCPGECGMVVSGINNGPNLGSDVLYSGTVSAAIEGALLGVPSMAVSLASYESMDYTVAAEVASLLAGELHKNRQLLPPDTILNVNVPAVPRSSIKGFKITRPGIIEYANRFEKRFDPRGNVYYWLTPDATPRYEKNNPGIDAAAVEQNYVSIMPIHFDLTNYRIIKQVKAWGLEKLKL